jgi:hypothetical protein
LEAYLELELIGHFGDLERLLNTYENVKIINGVTSGRQLVTLFNNIHMMKSFGAPGYFISRVMPQFVFLGHCFEIEEDFLFTKANYSCYNMEYFIGDSGLKPELRFNESNHLKSYRLTYECPSSDKFI